MTNHLAELNESNCRPLRLALVASSKASATQMTTSPSSSLPISARHGGPPECVPAPDDDLPRVPASGWSQDYYLFTPMGMLDPDDPEVATSIEITKRILGISDPKGAI